MPPSAAAATASSPNSAPVGTRMRPPCRRAKSTRSKLSSNAPQLRTITVRPCSSAGSASSRSTAAGAHSTTTSANCQSPASGITGTFCAKPSIPAFARATSRAAMAASVSPSMPSSRRWATTFPIAPNPPIATRKVTLFVLLVDPAWFAKKGASQLDIGRNVFGLDAIDGQTCVEPFADLLDAAVIVHPGVEELAPALICLHPHAHAGRQLHARLVQHLEFTECRVFLDCGQSQIDGENDAIGPPGLHGDDAVVARFQRNDRRFRRKAACCDLVHRADIDRHFDIGIVEVAPVRGVKALLPDHPEAVQACVKSMTSARFGVGLSENARSILLACRSSTEFP